MSESPYYFPRDSFKLTVRNQQPPQNIASYCIASERFQGDSEVVRRPGNAMPVAGPSGSC